MHTFVAFARERGSGAVETPRTERLALFGCECARRWRGVLALSRLRALFEANARKKNRSLKPSVCARVCVCVCARALAPSLQSVAAAMKTRRLGSAWRAATSAAAGRRPLLACRFSSIGCDTRCCLWWLLGSRALALVRSRARTLAGTTKVTRYVTTNRARCACGQRMRARRPRVAAVFSSFFALFLIARVCVTASSRAGP